MNISSYIKHERDPLYIADEKFLQKVKDQLLSGDKCVIIYGSLGAGKTCFAIELAYRLCETYSVRWLDCETESKFHDSVGFYQSNRKQREHERNH